MPTYTARRGWQRFLQTRIPTLFGLGILILGVVVGIVLLGQGTTGFLPRASEDAAPKAIRITNITDTGFTVSFLTDVSAPGYIEYGTAPNRTNVQVRDDRDQLANTAGSFVTHHITVRGLSPTTQYYFRLGTGGRTKYDNNGQPFAVRTARPVAAGAEARTAYGSINTEVGNPADGSLVYLSIQGASPLSAQVKADGTWALPLSGVRSLDLSGAVELTNETPVRVEVQGSRTSDTLVLDTTVGAMMPLQTLQFGRPAAGDPGAGGVTDPASGADTDGTHALDGTNPGGANPDSSGDFASLVGEDGSQVAAPAEVDIRLEDQEVVTTTQPEFQGTAPPGKVLQIEVHSETPYYGAVQVGQDGEWNWTPPADLEPGEHTVTVTYTDDNGQQQRVQRTFLVQAGGESSVPSFVSTPSATTATPTPVATPFPTPKMIAQATATPTPVPTALTSTASGTTPVATAPAQPVSGTTRATWMLLAVAVGCFVVGGGTTALAWQARKTAEDDSHA